MMRRGVSVRIHRQNLVLASLCAALLGAVAEPVLAAGWLGPSTMTASPDGKRLYVANVDAKQVAVVDPAAGKVIGSVAVPTAPTGLAVDREGKKLYVACGAPRSIIAVIDATSLKIEKQFAAGHTAIGPALSPDGKRLYVCNRFDNNVSVIDVASGKELARVATVREPYAAAITPDGKTVFVANHLPLDRCDSYDVAAVVTAIDAASNQATAIRMLNGTTGVRGITVSPDGKYVYVTHILARYQMPTTQLERGWMNTNGLTIIDAQTKKLVNTVLLDDVDLGAANPWGVACSADGQIICAAHFGTHELSVIRTAKLFEKLAKVSADPKAAPPADAKKPADPKAPPVKEERSVYSSTTAADVPNDLAFLVDIRQRVALESRGLGPQGVVVIGSKAYAAQYFSDSLTVVDLAAAPEKAIAAIALGPAPTMTVQRRGEQLFADARICFQHWQSCASCHPDTRVDALNWDLMNDGLGNPKNNKTMLLAHQTPPAMWTGVRPNGEAGVRSGITHILFAVRPEEEAVAMDEYLKALAPVPSPHLADGRLSPAAERGKALFFAKENGCAHCHPAPLYTDLLMHDVSSRGPYDHRDTFDTPGLVECWRTAPYMHDGHFLTIKELLTTGKHGHKGYDVDKLTPKQIDDLVEFVLSL